MNYDPVTLYRINPARNMQRYYRLDIQPDLFGNHCLLREWGRIGRPGQVRIVGCFSETPGDERTQRISIWKGGEYMLAEKIDRLLIIANIDPQLSMLNFLQDYLFLHF